MATFPFLVGYVAYARLSRAVIPLTTGGECTITQPHAALMGLYVTDAEPLPPSLGWARHVLRPLSRSAGREPVAAMRHRCFGCRRGIGKREIGNVWVAVVSLPGCVSLPCPVDGPPRSLL